MTYEWELQTGKLIVNDEKCLDCDTKACISACEKCGRNILEIRDGKVRLKKSEDENAERCIECLACEYACQFRGNKAIEIKLPIEGLEEYRERAKKELEED